MKRKLLRSIASLTLIAAFVLGAGWALAQDATETPEASDNTGTPVLGILVNDDPAGALVSRVVSGSPAADAGLQEGDIVTSLDGETVTAASLAQMIGERSVGDTVALQVLRGGETLDLNVTLGARGDFELPTPEARSQGQQPVPPLREQRQQRARGPFLGVALEDTDNGVTIQQIAPNSPAADAGLQVGDVITSVNGDAVSSAGDVVAAIRAMNAGDTLTLEIERDGETQTIEATLGQSSSFAFLQEQDIIVYNQATEQWQVVRLAEDSALYEAGLRDGDIITQIDGNSYAPDTLSDYLNSLDDNATVTLTVERSGESMDISAPASALDVLVSGFFGFGRGGDMPFHFNMPFDMPFGMMGGSPIWLGVTFVQLDAQTAAEHNVDVTEGALITEVADGSPAADAGLQANDVITAVDGDVVDAERTLRDRLFAYEPDDTVTLSVLRDGQSMDVSVTLGAAQAGVQGRYGMDGMMPFFFGPNGAPAVPDSEATPDFPMA